MFEFISFVYFALLALLFASDIVKGVLDAAMKQPALKEAAELVGDWLNELVREQALQARQRRSYSYAACTWESCESMRNGAGKAIAMK